MVVNLFFQGIEELCLMDQSATSYFSFSFTLEMLTYQKINFFKRKSKKRMDVSFHEYRGNSHFVSILQFEESRDGHT